MRFQLLALAAVCSMASASFNNSKTNLTAAAQSLFDFSMSVNDIRWDDSYKVLWYNNNGPWSIRFTIWYTSGLLHRAEGNDVENAIAAIKAVLATQMIEDYDSAWYGDFKLSPDEPNPQTPFYTPAVYSTYDPNWIEFIGTTLVQLVSEFETLLGPSLVSQIETALAYGAVGSMRRNGTAPDNLILAYSNPRYMRALNVGWIGARLNNQTFIDFGNEEGENLYGLFSKNGANTLGEYNAPTYYGMDMWAIAGMVKYGPVNATFTKYAPVILEAVWEDIADHYNPYLGNMVGPYDRAYTRDLTAHSGVISQFFWGLFGYDCSPVPPKGDIDLQYDGAQGAAISLLISTVFSILPASLKTRLQAPITNGTERQLNKTVYYTLESNSSRTATSWISKELMIGGQVVNETVNRGKQFTPAIIHWASDPTHKPFPYNGFFSLYPTASTLSAVATANTLTISYPNTTQDGTDSFQYMISGIPPPWNLAGNVVNGFNNMPCLNVTVESEGLEIQNTTYGSMIYDHYYYNVTYVVPQGFVGVPTMKFGVEYTC